ncbi:LuxR C-terminal-related transcriptional regulator [uncultured Duncaniella sp.]|uniref:LuxR C-terminal-related transcriptional regulator n=1 Tax=uncultured Duncaniella sp. TaxID=2768039 RepID=UPI0025E5C0F4|nr:LuxR C-terminal-related transcriptional regulator [uncultured Duncaniella sp.]
MKNLIWILILAALGMVACSRSVSYYDDVIAHAETVVSEDPDSALSMLEVIDPTELSVDSLKAKYHYLMASAHEMQGHVMLADSMIRYSVDYYKDRDLPRAIKSATLLALYKLWSGDGRTAIKQLDSLSNLANVPDSLMIYPLVKRAYWGLKVSNSENNRKSIRRLLSIDKDSASQNLYKYWLYVDYLYNGDNDSALVVLNELIDKAINDKASSKQFSYEYEKIGVLEEMDRYDESLLLTDKFLEKAPENSIKHYIHLWRSLALFNMGKMDMAIHELGKADSCASVISDAEKGYYNSFAYVLYTVFDFQKTGKLKLIRMAQINNIQKDNLLRSLSIQRESEQNALEIENKRLILKAKNERQTAMTVIIVLAGFLISGILSWYALNRKRKAIEKEEQVEALQKMVDELTPSASPSSGQESLRRAMLQQLGIIKMVAETPTEQNREMLRKISSIDSDTKGALVNWNNVFEIIDNLYAGFYSCLHQRYGDLLTDREKQIIVLMMAGFSTKEISVITAQTTATIYVRKSSVRKKLGLPEKEDIVAFLHREVSV